MTRRPSSPWGARRAAPLLASVALAGCASPLTGTWGERDVGDERLENRMTIGSDGTGLGIIQFFWQNDDGTVSAEPYEDRFEIEWEATSDSEFRLDMVCVESTFDPSSCADHDFVQECELGASDGELDCVGSEPWQNYSLTWERR